MESLTEFTSSHPKETFSCNGEGMGPHQGNSSGHKTSCSTKPVNCGLPTPAIIAFKSLMAKDNSCRCRGRQVRILASSITLMTLLSISMDTFIFVSMETTVYKNLPSRENLLAVGELVVDNRVCCTTLGRLSSIVVAGFTCSTQTIIVYKEL